MRRWKKQSIQASHPPPLFTPNNVKLFKSINNIKIKSDDVDRGDSESEDTSEGSSQNQGVINCTDFSESENYESQQYCWSQLPDEKVKLHNDYKNIHSDNLTTEIRQLRLDIDDMNKY